MSHSPPFVTPWVLPTMVLVIMIGLVVVAFFNRHLATNQREILEQQRTILADLTAHRQYHELAYSIGPSREWIRCHRCGKTSYAPGDIQHLWCEHCGIFHVRRRDDPVPVEGSDVS